MHDGAARADRFRAQWSGLAAEGLTGIGLSDLTAGRTDAVLAASELEAAGRTGRDQGLMFSLGAHRWAVVESIVRFGTEAQRARLLPALCEGQLVGAFAASEPDAGSDVVSLHTSATPSDDDDPATVALWGTKWFVTNGPVADVAVVLATTDPARGWAGLSTYLVERHTVGTDWRHRTATVGLTSSPIGQISFVGCRVGPDDRLGPAGAGLAVFQHALSWERGLILAPVVGRLRWLVGQLGRGGGPVTRHRIARAHERATLTHLLLHRHARLRASGANRRAVDADASLVKLAVSEAWVVTAAELPAELAAEIPAELDAGTRRPDAATELADALASRVYSGTSEMQRDLLGQRLGLP